MNGAAQRLAVSSLDWGGLGSDVSPHFGRCPTITLVEVRDGRIQSHEVVANPYAERHEPGQVPALFAELGATAVLAGGMGRRAITLLEGYGIEASVGHTGSVRGAVESFVESGARRGDACAGGHPDGCAGHGE